MTNTQIRKYLNSLPKFFRKKTYPSGYVEDYTNYELWLNGLGPNEWHY